MNHDTEMNLRGNVLSAFVSSGMNVTYNAIAKIDPSVRISSIGPPKVRSLSQYALCSNFRFIDLCNSVSGTECQQESSSSQAEYCAQCDRCMESTYAGTCREFGCSNLKSVY